MSTARAYRVPRPAGLLPQAGDDARVAHQHRRIQVADVDAQLQRRGCGYPQQAPALAQAALDLPALFGAVAGAVGADAAGQFGRFVLQDAPGVEQNELGHAAGAGEGDGADAGLYEPGKEGRCLDVRAAPGSP